MLNTSVALLNASALGAAAALRNVRMQGATVCQCLGGWSVIRGRKAGQLQSITAASAVCSVRMRRRGALSAQTSGTANTATTLRGNVLQAVVCQTEARMVSVGVLRRQVAMRCLTDGTATTVSALQSYAQTPLVAHTFGTSFQATRLRAQRRLATGGSYPAVGVGFLRRKVAVGSALSTCSAGSTASLSFLSRKFAPNDRTYLVAPIDRVFEIGRV